MSKSIFCYYLSLEEDCTASATNDWNCCDNKAEKCGENEGDCDFDSHCKAGLKCGTDNCPSGFPLNYDCCYKESGNPIGPNNCTASSMPKDPSCCNIKTEKCGENEGDCDNDSHCKAGLKCGTDNCPSVFPSHYDCCYKPSGNNSDCTASTPKDPSCCNKKTEKCGENEGDCDNDSHCKAGLKCGTDNCPSGFPSLYDCCYKPSSIVYCGEAIKCGENEGDCDNDSHCKAGLKCGTDNCPSNFPSYYDCCYKGSGTVLFIIPQILSSL